MPKKCFSKCHQISEAECEKTDKCYFVNGKTRKFCRLQNKYKMDKDCNIIDDNDGISNGISNGISISKRPCTYKIKVKKQKTKGTVKKDISNPTSSEVKKAKQIKAMGIIQNFMKRTKHMRKAEFLKAVCSDSGVCIAFGNYANEINKHFGGFKHFDYATTPINRIGNPSANGFIHEIPYIHRGYNAYAVLKSAMKPDSDNLLYEYLVGQYINKCNKLFPCFLETYGYYTYTNPSLWKKVKTTKLIDSTDILKTGLTLHTHADFDIACTKSKYLCILIQHLKGIKSIKKMMSYSTFVENELLLVLFQVYMPLLYMKNNFTHYDLHNENVNLYEPVKDSYIEFHYNDFHGKTITFKSKYITKIIDYGRSYFKDDETGINSKKIYRDLCAQKKCKPACGDEKGFGWLYDDGLDNSTNFFISSQKRNMSHDLRLLNEIKMDSVNYDTAKHIEPSLRAVLNKLNYNQRFGTPEANNGMPATIMNVSDAAHMFGNLLSELAFIEANNRVYVTKTKLGDLHIYNDGRPMRFVKSVII